MADQFGGIPVDEPRTDEFGGIAVDEKPAARPGILGPPETYGLGVGAPGIAPVSSDGFFSRVRAGFREIPHDTADVFMEGVRTTAAAPEQIDRVAPNPFADIGENIQKQLITAGASEEEAKREADRIIGKMQSRQGLMGLVMGPLQALTAPLFGPVRSLVSRPIEETTGFPKEATEGYLQIAAAAAPFLPHHIARVRVGEDGAVTARAIGPLPAAQDFATAAADIAGPRADRVPIAAENIRSRWEQDGIHPAETVHDAATDGFLRKVLTELDREPPDRSGVVPVRGSTVPEGTPRSELGRTGEAHIDDVLESIVTKRNIDNPVIDATHDVPYAAGGSTPLEDPTVYIDRHFPRSMTIDGVRFDPAEPFTIHENVEQHVMEQLIRGGMDQETAYRVAHFEFAEKAEGAWYAAHGIDQAAAEAAYRPFLDQIQHENPENPPPNLYRKPYPHDDVNAAKGEPLAEPGPTKEEIARAKEIMAADDSETPLRAVGADVTTEPPPSLAAQPAPRPGRLGAMVADLGAKVLDLRDDLQRLVAPMAMGSNAARAVAKDFANAVRRNRWEWQRIDADIAKRFTVEQRKRMWDAGDEESVLRQEGQTSEHMGHATLEPEERAAVEDLQSRAQAAWIGVRDLGMVEGEGLPAYTPRMIINAATVDDATVALNRIPYALGRNLRTSTPQMLHRKYLTAEETEAAAKAALGEEAVIARDIRALPLATAKMEDAIAGRTLINQIKEIGRQTGEDTVAEGFRPGPGWITVDHPAFRMWRPKLQEVGGKMQAALDADGNTIFQQVPLYVRGDFEGPLRAVLSQPSGPIYGALMAIKGKTMGLIMNSPLIHNAVEWGRALPAMPGKVVTFKVYFEGNAAKNGVPYTGALRYMYDHLFGTGPRPAQASPTMLEAIDGGLVPIGKRFFNQDITSIMEEPNIAPGRSWTAQVLGAFPGLFDEGAGNAVKAAIDKAGNFYHNVLLWDRIGDLQMGLYVNFRGELLAKGVDRQTAVRVAAHWGNRYAGALPQEAMSSAATKLSNLTLFSRSFTMGNLGAMKDMLTGLPRDVLAQIERDAGFPAGGIATADSAAPAAQAVAYAKSLARRKAIAVIALDVGLMYVGNSILQSAINVLRGDKGLDEEMRGYATRMADALQDRGEHPLKLLQPFDFLERVSSTSENEPGKQNRIRVGYAADGTAIYARNPVGKIGEEFTGWLTGPLDMIRRKLGTIARPLWQTLANDKGFGRKVYDQNADTPEKYVRNAVAIATHFVGSQLPEGQISAISDLVKGEGDPKVNTLAAVGPVAGVTFSRGAPGGPAVGEMYTAKAMHQYAVDAALPDIRRQIQRGDVTGAQEAMTQLGIPRDLQKFYVRTTMNPATRLSPRALRDFYLYATPEQRRRLEGAPTAPPGP